MKTALLVIDIAVAIALGSVVYVTLDATLTRPSNLDPPPPPYVWYRINPETTLTCLIVEAQYNQHPIAMWCERIVP